MAQDYKQFDELWAGHIISNTSSNVKAVGCGPSSIADLVVSSTPPEIADFMGTKGWIGSSGSDHEAISKTLSNYGISSTLITPSEIGGLKTSLYLNQLENHLKAGKCAILLMGSLNRGGCISNFWTKGGHYIACVGYNNGQALIYDPGSSTRSGYHNIIYSGYLDDLGGCVRLIWLCNIVGGKTNSNAYYGGAKPATNDNTSLLGTIFNPVSSFVSSLSNITLVKNVSTYTAQFEERSVEVTKDIIKTIDINSIKNGGYTNLVSYPSLVEVPFILFRVGKYTFGKYTRENSGLSVKVDFPNYIESMTVKKINGQLNLYTINLSYQITTGDDPNLLDKIFSSVGFGRVYITYGDYASPTFVYREEEAILTKVSSAVDFNNSKISYTVQCTSSALLLAANTFDFEKRTAKPSDVIIELLYNSKYGLTDVFTGMKNKTSVINNNLIATDDSQVEILAKPATDPLTYLQYLVTCMSANTNNSNSILKDSTYKICLYDDNFGDLNLNGPYFKIIKVSSNAKVLATADTYEVDIGYPTDNLVISFNVNSDNSWNLLYNYSDTINTPKYTYDIDNKGNIITNYSPNYATNKTTNYMTESLKTWWTNMTQFPISATLTIKGLIRPTVLMTYIKVNSLFFGEKHDTSGLYIITGQTDTISDGGYRTALALTRVAGDADYIEKTTQTVTSLVLVGYEREDRTITIGDAFGSVKNLISSTLTGSAWNNSQADFEFETSSGSIANNLIYSSGSSNEDAIWNALMRLIGNTYGVAGLMGNLKHESNLKSNTVEGLCINAIKEYGGPNYGPAYQESTNKAYTQAVNNGTISRSEFLVPLLKYGNPKSSIYSTGRHYGYGLAQWTDDSRKGGLYDFMMGRGNGIDDPAGQAEYIIKELKSGSFSGVLASLKSATNIDSATEIVYYKYERPASSDTSLSTRKKYAKEIYTKYTG